MNIPENSPTDLQPDWARLLPREAFQEIILILRGALPPPLSDDPADWARRDRAAMAAVAALWPENAAEGRLAAQFVAADAYAMDCLRLAKERRLELEIARKCRAQAMAMMREGKSALRVLLRLQAARRAIEENEEAAGRAAWAEHGAMGMMEEALSSAPAGPGAPAEAVTPDARNGRPPPSPPSPAAGGERTETTMEKITPGNVWGFRLTSKLATDTGKKRFETDAGFRPRPARAAL
jgi:hypothetical protein